MRTNSIVTYFKDKNRADTDKTIFGRVSESVRTGLKGDDGKDVYAYENWNARFVGKAYEKAKTLEDKTAIVLTNPDFHNPYNQEKGRTYPSITVFDFEIHEKK